MSNSTTSSTDTVQAGDTGSQFLIDGARGLIDEWDRQIARAIATRIELATGIQAYKVLSGLPQVDLRREGEVIDHYVRLLGPLGRDVAEAILDLSKG